MKWPGGRSPKRVYGRRSWEEHEASRRPPNPIRTQTRCFAFFDAASGDFLGVGWKEDGADGQFVLWGVEQKFKSDLAAARWIEEQRKGA